MLRHSYFIYTACAISLGKHLATSEAHLLTKVWKDVEIEPSLQPVTEERLTASTLIGDEARPDVRARGFWRSGQNAYFEIRVTNADAESQRSVDIKKVLSKHKKEKKRHHYSFSIVMF